MDTGENEYMGELHVSRRVYTRDYKRKESAIYMYTHTHTHTYGKPTHITAGRETDTIA